MNNENFPHASWDCFGPESKIFITMAYSRVLNKSAGTLICTVEKFQQALLFNTEKYKKKLGTIVFWFMRIFH